MWSWLCGQVTDLRRMILKESFKPWTVQDTSKHLEYEQTKVDYTTAMLIGQKVLITSIAGTENPAAGSY